MKFDVDILQGSSTGLGNINETINRLKSEIAIVLGVENLLLGFNRVGNFALSKEKGNQLSLIIDGAMADIALSIKNDVLVPIFSLNGWEKELIPEIQPEAASFRDVSEITTALKDIALA